MMKRIFGLVLVVAGFAVVSAQEAPQAPGARRRRPQEQFVLAPKAVKLSEYVAPHKPHTKLAEVLAKHKGQADWVEPVVDDDNLHADYISMGPGKKTPRRMNADTREWWVIQDGQIRFTIDGQEPFVASKGYLVQVPYRNMYTDGNGRRSAVAALRGEHREGAQDVSDGREARAGAGLRLRAGARARARAPTPKATSRSSTSTRSWPAPTRRAGSCTTIARSRTSSSAPASHRRRSPTKGTSIRRAPSSGSSSSTRFATTSKGLPVFEADQGDIVYVPEDAVPPGQLRRHRAVLPPRDERLHGPVALVRGANAK